MSSTTAPLGRTELSLDTTRPHVHPRGGHDIGARAGRAAWATSGCTCGRSHRLAHILGWLCHALVVCIGTAVLVSIAAVTSLRWVQPPTTAYMLRDAYLSQQPGSEVEPPIRQWVDVDAVSRTMLVGVVGHEDPGFLTREGAVDPVAFRARARALIGGQPDPSGSTIDQQLAKNLWGYKARTPTRKAIELWMASLMADQLTKKQRLELYVNSAEFGNGVWGICAASWWYFGIAPNDLDVDQGAQLVGLLPAPKTFSRAPGGGVLHEADDIVAWSRAHITTQLDEVGNLNATERLGIRGLARDYKGPDDCRSMPPAIQQRLAAKASTT